MSRAENGLLKKTKDGWNKIIENIKWFFYGISVVINKAYRKIIPARTKTLKSGNIGAAVFAHLLILYPLLQFAIFYVYVNFNSILLSLQSYNINTSKFSFSGFGNFKKVFIDIVKDPTMGYCVKNSLLSYVLCLVIGFPLNLTFAYVVYKKVPCAGFFQVVLFLPQLLSSIVVSMMFEMCVREAVPYVAEKLFKVEELYLLGDPKYIFGTMIFYALWSGFGSALILYSGAMSRIPDSIIEYGELEGISLWAEFWHVCLPMIYSTISIFLVTGVAGIFTNQLNLFNFYGMDASYKARTLGYHFFIMVLGENANYIDYPYASAAGLIFSLVATPITLLARHLLEKYGPEVEF